MMEDKRGHWRTLPGGHGRTLPQKTAEDTGGHGRTLPQRTAEDTGGYYLDDTGGPLEDNGV